MIGTHHQGYKIIAALPINGNDEGHMIVTGKSLPQPGKRHQPRFVTCFTDGQGQFCTPVYFTDHRATATMLKSLAIGDMIRRAGHMLSALT